MPLPPEDRQILRISPLAWSAPLRFANDRGPSSSQRSVALTGWFRRHRHSARSGSGRNQDRGRRQGSRALRSALACSAGAEGWDRGAPTSPGMRPRMPDHSRHRVVTDACNCSEQLVAQNRKEIERLTRARPARPVAAKMDREWITGSSSTPKT